MVIGLVCDLRYELGIEDMVVLIDCDESSCQDASEGAVLDQEAVAFAEVFAAHHRKGGDVLDVFLVAKTLLRERKVCGDDDDLEVRMCFGLGVEMVSHCAANARVETRHCSDEFTLAFEVF